MVFLSLLILPGVAIAPAQFANAGGVFGLLAIALRWVDITLKAANLELVSARWPFKTKHFTVMLGSSFSASRGAAQ